MKIKSIHQDVWIGLLIVILCAAFFMVNKTLSSDSGMMPRLLLGMMGILGLLITNGGYKKTKQAAENNPAVKMISLQSMKEPVKTYFYIIMYVVLFKLVGYFVATPVFLLSLMHHFKIKSLKLPIIVTSVYLIIIYAFFVRQLNVSVDNLGALGSYISMNY